MNKIIISALVAGGMIIFNSCSKDNQEEPSVQWFPVITLEGDDTYYVELGEDFTVPGFTAVNTLTGEDASDRVEVYIYDTINGEYVDEIDTSSPGVFEVQYVPLASEVQLSPDFDVFKTRNIYVYDPSVTISIEGNWVVDMTESYELFDGDQYPFIDDYGDVESIVTISKILPGFFSDADLMAGFYSTILNMDKGYPSYLATYGPNCFKLTGFLSMNSEGDITLLSWEAYSGFFDGYSMSNASYDETTETITYDFSLTWDPFGGEPQYHIVLVKSQE